MYNLYISYMNLGYNTDTDTITTNPVDLFCGSVYSEDELLKKIDSLQERLDQIGTGYVYFHEFGNS